MRRGGPLTERLHPKKIRAALDATFGPEGEARHGDARTWPAKAHVHQQRLLLVDRDRQADAALAAAVREDLRSTLRCHAGSETVGAQAAGVVGLKSSLRLCHDG